jgi:hypothetical protein
MRNKHFILVWLFYALFSAITAQTIDKTDICYTELKQLIAKNNTLTLSKIARYQQCMRQIGYTQAQVDKFSGNYPLAVGLRGSEEATNVCINQVGICVNVMKFTGDGVDEVGGIFTASQPAIFLDRPITYTFPTKFTTDSGLENLPIKVFVNFGDGKGEVPITAGQAITISYPNIAASASTVMMTCRVEIQNNPSVFPLLARPTYSIFQK